MSKHRVMRELDTRYEERMHDGRPRLRGDLETWAPEDKVACIEWEATHMIHVSPRCPAVTKAHRAHANLRLSIWTVREALECPSLCGYCPRTRVGYGWPKAWVTFEMLDRERVPDI